jgi:hypothetical protein
MRVLAFLRIIDMTGSQKPRWTPETAEPEAAE